MQPHVEARSVTSKGVALTGSFGMRAENSAHIFGILRSQLYSNKVLAVLREYGANAWDEHRAAGCPDRPIKVVLPTALEPTLRIRDYGRGLSEEQVFAVYTQYGSSTKRSDNLTVGAMGIGSKSAFAYTDSFTVTSWHDGQKSIYQAVLDETNVGTMSLMWRGPCDPAETGIEVSMSVSVRDCNRFHAEAMTLFKHFNPPPDINCTIPPQKILSSPHGDSDKSDADWIAVMGCIPYPLRINNFADALTQAKLPILRGGVLCLDIGEVSVSGSREELEYTPNTCKALLARYTSLIEDLRTQVKGTLDGCTESWTKRLLIRDLGLLAIQLHSNLNGSRVEFPQSLLDSYSFFTVSERLKKLEAEWSIPVRHGVRLVLKDCRRSFLSVAASEDDDYLVVLPNSTHFGDESIAKFQEALEKIGLDGIPTIRLSEMPSDKPSQATPRVKTTPNAKKRVFVLKDVDFSDLLAPSNNWESVEITPSDDDVYVILEYFVPQTFSGRRFADLMRTYKGMLNWLGVPVPRIVGYRHSESKPVNLENVKGTPLTKWVTQAVQDALDTNAVQKEQVEASYWVEDPLLGSSAWFDFHRKNFLGFAKTLGEDHILVQFLRKLMVVWSKYGRTLGEHTSKGEVVRAIRDIIPDGSRMDTRRLVLTEIYAQYPLLDKKNHGPSLECFLSSHACLLWANYIQMVDSQTKALQAQESA
jgi:hypothetical protein